MMKGPTATSPWAALVVALLFAGFGVAGMLHHEMWLDETHHWLLARDSQSFSELIFNARYEGHPFLWNALLFILSRFTSDPVAMQALHVSISVISVFLLFRYSLFSLLNKLLIVCSYFIFYEYTIISRNYSLAFLLLVIVCILFKEKQNRFLLFSLALALLAQTHLFAAVIAGAILLLVCFDLYGKKKITQEKFPRSFAAGSLLVLFSLALVLFQAIPPGDHFIYAYDTDPLFSFKRIGKGISVLWKGLFPVPAFGADDPWNSNLVIAFSKQLAIIPVSVAWIIPAVLLVRKQTVLIFFYVTAFCIALFLYFSPVIVSVRHCGFLFLLLLAALWISEYFSQTSEPQNKFSLRFRRLSGRIAKPVFTFILIVQGIAAAYMYISDWNRPFSNGKAVAEWLTNNVDPQKTVIVNDHFAGPPVSAYFGKKVYYVENNATGSFCKWNTQPFMIPQEVLLEKISRLVETDKPKEPVWLVTNKPLHIPSENKEDINLVINFSGALVQAENYWVYSISTRWQNQKHTY